MSEKKKKKKKPESNIKVCIDCDCETDDYYKIQTNRGNIIKCAECYELWILRSTRMSSCPLLRSNEE